MAARICNISPALGPVTVKLSASNALISGGDFKIYDFNSGTVNESFKLHTNNSGNATYQVAIPVTSLVGQVLSWQVLTCAPVITNTGIVKIEIFQNGNLCSTIPLASYNLQNVPNCSISLAMPLQGGLHFQ